MYYPLVASDVTNVTPRILYRSVVVKSTCRICGQTEQKQHHIPEDMAAPESLPFTCNNCTAKYDSLGRPIRQRKVKSLSLDYRATDRPPEGMTGTAENPGTREPEDVETLEREARWRSNLVKIAQEDVLDLAKDLLAREVLRLVLIERKSLAKACRELNAAGFTISRAHVANVKKAEVARLRKLLKPLGLDGFMGAGVPYTDSPAEAVRVFLDGDTAQDSLGGSEDEDGD